MNPVLFNDWKSLDPTLPPMGLGVYVSEEGCDPTFLGVDVTWELPLDSLLTSPRCSTIFSKLMDASDASLGSFDSLSRREERDLGNE